VSGAVDEAHLGHRNLITYSAALARWCQHGSLVERDGVLAYAGGSWLPVVCNGAFRTDDSVAPAVVFEVADAFFAEQGRGYSLKLRDSGEDDDLRAASEAHGLAAFGEPAPEMICRTPLATPELPPGVVLERVSDVDGVADFIAVSGEAYGTYGMPPDVAASMFDRPEAVLAEPDTAIVVARREGQPLAAAMVFCSDGIASLQWVGTVTEARQLHLGAAVTVWATNEAFARGASSCTLQASVMGQSLYHRLGYKTLYHYGEYVTWKAPASPT
jgi:hypothetical protein